MRDQRPIRLPMRCAAIALFVASALGTRCAGPAAYVFRRYSLPSGAVSRDTLPLTLSVRGYTFSQPAPRQHWWDHVPRQNCDGFQLYRIDHLPAGISADSLSALPPSAFELLMNRGATPALVVFYQYNLPLRTLDPGNPDGAAQAARIARQEAVMDSAADEIARKFVASAGMAERIAPVDTERTQSPEARRDRCKAEVARARSSP